MSFSDLFALINIKRFDPESIDPYMFLIQDGKLVFSPVLSALSYAAILLCILFIALEITRLSFQGLVSDKMTSMKSLVIAVLVLLLVTIPTFYQAALKSYLDALFWLPGIVGKTNADFASMHLYEHFLSLTNIKTLFWTLFKVVMEATTPLFMINMAGQVGVLVTLHLIKYLVAFYVTIYFCLGPVFLPFSIYKPFRMVTIHWFLNITASAFIMFFAMLSISLIGATNLIKRVTEAGVNFIPSFVFSLVIIAMLLYSVYISFTLFGAFKIKMMAGIKTTKRMISMGLS